MKRILFTNPYGPYDLEWGENQYDILESRLQRGQGPFTMKSQSPCHALYLIAENLNNAHHGEFRGMEGKANAGLGHRIATDPIHLEVRTIRL